MLKFLLILFIIFYVIYKASGFLMKSVFRSVQNQHRAQYQNQQSANHSHKKAPNSNLNIEYVPKDGKEHNSNFEGGDYVDYEEVK